MKVLVGRSLLQRGINITGVLGVLLEARQGLIVAVKLLMEQLMNEVEFWVSRQVDETVLLAAENPIVNLR